MYIYVEKKGAPGCSQEWQILMSKGNYDKNG